MGAGRCRQSLQSVTFVTIYSRFPLLIRFRHTSGAWPVSRGNSSLLIREEDPVPDILSFGNISQRRRAVQPAIDLQFSVPAQSSWHFTFILFSVFINQMVSFHREAFLNICLPFTIIRMLSQPAPFFKNDHIIRIQKPCPIVRADLPYKFVPPYYSLHNIDTQAYPYHYHKTGSPSP